MPRATSLDCGLCQDYCFPLVREFPVLQIPRSQSCVVTQPISHTLCIAHFHHQTPIPLSAEDTSPVFHSLETKLNLRKELIVVGGFAFSLLLLLFGFGASSLCSMAGFFYPAWKSFEAIETKRKDDDTQWLIYWVVYSFFSIIEIFIDTLLYWIPFYYVFKFAFLLWLMSPQTKGAVTIYHHFLKDFLKKNESKIDEAINKAKRSASGAAETISSGASAGAAAAGKVFGNKED